MLFETIGRVWLPEHTMFLSAVILLMLGVMLKSTQRSSWSAMSISRVRIVKVITILAAVTILCGLVQGLLLERSRALIPIHGYWQGNLLLHNFTYYGRMIVMLGAFLVLLVLADGYSLAWPYEVSILLLIATAALTSLVSCRDWLMLYLTTEMSSFAAYVGITILRDKTANQHDYLANPGKAALEAGLKYFVLTALSSGIFLFAISIIYGKVGFISFDALRSYLEGIGDADHLLVMAIVMATAALCFKMAAAPFHMWIGDVYQGAHGAITMFLASVAKFAATLIFIKIACYIFLPTIPGFIRIIEIISIFSMTVGTFGAIAQREVKRLMAYSSVSHIGLILSGLTVSTDEAIQAALLYAAVYTITMVIPVFAILLLLKPDGGAMEIGSFKGLGKKRPYLAGCLTLLLLTMIGVPPFSGFFCKLALLIPLVKRGNYLMAVAFITTTAIGSYYYLNIVKLMYFVKLSPKEKSSELKNERSPVWFNKYLNSTISLSVAVISLGVLFSTTFFWYYQAAIAAMSKIIV